MYHIMMNRVGVSPRVRGVDNQNTVFLFHAGMCELVLPTASGIPQGFE